MGVRERHTHRVLGLEDSNNVSFHDRRFRDREAIWNGARTADLDCEFISQTDF